MANLRFYTQTPLNIGDNIQLSASAAAHATRALRLSINDEAIVFNGDGFDYTCVITSIQKNAVLVSIHSRSQVNNESPLNITLIQAISAGDRMDFTIQKAVELGVTTIQPVSSQRSVVKLNAERAEKRTEHWQNIAISACEQSGRAIVPTVLAPISLSQYFAQFTKNNTLDTLNLTLAPTASKSLQAYDKPNGVINLLIGAEGGLSADEIAQSKSHDFQAITLGPRILRTETAGLAAIAAIQTIWGDF